MQETATDTDLCPCCGNPLPLGLFARTHLASLPMAIRMMTHSSEDLDDIDVGESVIRAADRTFLLCEAPLPISWRQSPVRVRTWVECDARTAARLASQDTPPGLNTFVGQGVLASDIAFFSGSIGATVAIIPGEELPLIHRVEDRRVISLPSRPSHDQLVALYRRSWGNQDPVVDSNPAFRSKLNTALQQMFSRPCYREPVEPPAPLAGINPAEVLVAPPFDVGEEVSMATIGCSEVFYSGAPTELVSTVRNPSPEFVKSFSEFCYLSRLNSTLVDHGLIIPERTKIPDTPRMSSWLLLRPSAFQDVIGDTLEVDNEEVRLLAAIPIYPEEEFHANQAGSESLIERLISFDLDLADLSRPNSCQSP